MREVKFAATLNHLVGDARGRRQQVSSDLGISAAALTQYLKGQTMPTVDRLVAIAELFGVSLDYLILGEDSVAGPSGTLDYGPFARYMEAGLASARADAAVHTAFVAKIGSIIADRIDAAAQSAAKRPTTFSGMLDQQQALQLERFSKESIIAAMDLEEDLVTVEGEVEQGVAAGRFLDIVAENLSRKRRYHFVLSPDMPDLEISVEQFKALLGLQQLDKSDLGRCRFTIARESFYVGFCLFKLDVNSLRKNGPILYQYVQQYIGDDGWIGFTEPPSSDHLRVFLMNDHHRKLASRTLEALTKGTGA